MRKAIHRVLRPLGVDLTPYPVPDWLWLRQSLVVLFSVLQINCVLDVGAHFGEYAEFLREIGYDEEIISFEPVSENYSRLSARAAGARKWRTLRCALGEENRIKTINVAQCTDFSSFLAPSRYSAEAFEGKGRVARVEEVEMKRLDAVLDQAAEGIPNARIFLKMDTQGWDLPVLLGASGVLDRIVAIQSEISVKHIYEGMTDYTDSIAAMNAMGFDLVAMVPVSRESGLRVIEFDCLMVRRDLDLSPQPPMQRGGRLARA